MARNRPSRRSRRFSFSNLLGSRRTEQARRAPRRREVEQLEERQMLAAEGVGLTLFNDPLAGDQWHLVADGQFVAQPNSPAFDETRAVIGEDINILNAFSRGLTGNGIQVGIIAGGFDLDHPDLGNFVTSLGIDLVDDDTDPTYTDPNDFEGTALAGLVGATANNGIGGVGVAPGADLVPIRLDVDINDLVQVLPEDYVNAFTYLAGFANDTDGDGVLDPITQSETIEVYLHAWDIDDGLISRDADVLPEGVQNALQTSVALGRPYWEDDGNGVLDADEVDTYRALGSIHVVPTGNLNGPDVSVGFQEIGVLDSAVYDELANSRFTITVGAVDHGGDYENQETGNVTSWPGISPATLIVAPAGSSGINGLEITSGVDSGSHLWTTDIVGNEGQNVDPVFGFQSDGDFLGDTDYTSTFSDTSGSAAQVAGAVALILEENPDLTYREVQYILMASARQNDQFSETWVTNPFRFFNDSYQLPFWHSYNFDTDGDGTADIENGIIPNFQLDPSLGVNAALRELFSGSRNVSTDGGTAFATGDPDFDLPFLRVDEDMDGNPDTSPTLVDTTGFLLTEPSDEGPGAMLTILGGNAPTDSETGEQLLPEPILIFPPGYAEALNNANYGLFQLARPSSAEKVNLQFENGAGFTVSSGMGTFLEEYGYAHGVLDVSLAVEMARVWDEFGINLGEETTVTTGIQGGTGSVFRVQPRGNVPIGDNENFLVPGGFSDVDINTAFYEEFLKDIEVEEVTDFGDNPIGEIITNAPWFDPENGGIADVDGPDRGTPGLRIPLDPSVTEDFISVEWVELRTNLTTGDIDHLRVTLVSPDGTHTELTPYRAPNDFGTYAVQYEQSAQGTVVPNDGGLEIIDNTIGGGNTPIDPTQVDGSEEKQIVGVEATEPISGGEAWTFTTNRHWGELLSIEANSEDGGGAGQPWTIQVENWGSAEISFEQYEVAFHGVEATGSRIQGKIGVDDNAQGIDNQDNDLNFNFNRYLTFGEVSIDGGPSLAVVLDDASDSVRQGVVYETQDPDTGVEIRYAVVDLDTYLAAASTDLVTREAAQDALLATLLDAQGEQPLLAYQAAMDSTIEVSLTEQYTLSGDSPGEALTYQNFDFSQESFELGAVVVAEQFMVQHFARTQSGVAPTPAAAASTGVLQRFITGSDGNYFFDVAATPAPPTPQQFTDPFTMVFDEAAFNFAYDNWFNDYGGVTYEYNISLENIPQDDERRVDDDYSRLNQPDGFGDVTYRSFDKSYQVELFASPQVEVGGTSVIKDVNFLLIVDPADSRVEVSGTAFRDRNGDGVQQIGLEESLEGVMVFYDQNGNGVFDVGSELTATTDVNGQYNFNIEGLLADETASFVVDPATVPLDLEFLNPSDGSVERDIQPGNPAMDVNFTFGLVGGEPAQVTGTVFEDVDQNGVQNGAEDGIGNVRVYIDFNGNGVFDDTGAEGDTAVLTNATGNFVIESDATGTFNIRVDFDSNVFTQTAPSDNGGGIEVTLVDGQTSSGLGFGLFDSRTRDFGDLFVDGVFNYPTLIADNGARHVVVPGILLGSENDVDTDGFQSPVRNPGIDGLGDDNDGVDDEDGVTLVTGDILPNSTIEFDVVALGPAVLNAWVDFNNNGSWDDPGEQIFINVNDTDFAGLGSGSVTRVSAPTPADVDVTAEVLAARFRWGPIGLSYDGAANAGEVEDYLLPTTPPITVNGVLTIDENGNMVADGADTVLANALVFHDANMNGVLDDDEPRNVSDANGAYQIQVNATSDTDLNLRIDPTSIDSQLGFINPASGLLEITAAAGSTVSNADFLLFVVPPVTVTGTVLVDADGDTEISAGDTPLANATVFFDANLNGVLDGDEVSAVTDANGDYQLGVETTSTIDLTLRVDETTINPQFDSIIPIDGIFSQTVDPSESVTADFLYGAPQGVSGRVFDDADNSGSEDNGETGFSGLAVEIYDDPNTDGVFDTLVASTTTDASGDFSISGLAAGDYEVAIVIPGGSFLTQTTPLANGGRISANVVSGQFVENAVFGVFDVSTTFTEDFGDLFIDVDNFFPTLNLDAVPAEDGASHTVVPGVFLGAGVDADSGSLESSNATADDNNQTDDEDGVVLVSTEILANSTIEIDVTATGVGATLDAWIDFNGDGDWNDAGERIATDVGLVSGVTSRLVVNTPADVAAAGTQVAARFRWGAGSVDFFGPSASGEVEDYYFSVDGSQPIAGDYDGNGVVEQADYDVWLANFGSTTQLAADGNNDGVVDIADYSIWRDALAAPAMAQVTAPEADVIVDLTVAPIAFATAPVEEPVAPVEESAPMVESVVIDVAPAEPVAAPSPTLALLVGPAVDESLAVGPVADSGAAPASDDTLEEALLEWSLAGPAAPASDSLELDTLDDEGEEDDDLALAVVDEVFAF